MTQIAPDSGVAEGERIDMFVRKLRTSHILSISDQYDISDLLSTQHATIARLQREAEGLRRERDWMRRNAPLAYSQYKLSHPASETQG